MTDRILKVRLLRFLDWKDQVTARRIICNVLSLLLLVHTETSQVVAASPMCSDREARLQGLLRALDLLSTSSTISLAALADITRNCVQ